jgi:hypothetical protein
MTKAKIGDGYASDGKKLHKLWNNKKKWFNKHKIYLMVRHIDFLHTI